MRRCVCLVLGVVALAVIAPAGNAQLFGSKKPKTPPQQRVPELIVVLRSDKDAHKRADAAEELRQFEPKDFPEIIPVLIDALQNDQAASVRIEAATGLGRLRPISLPAGAALEKAAASDSNLRSRLQAKTSLVYYQLSGYHAPKKADPQGPALTSRTDEPPLAETSGTANTPWWNNGTTPAKTMLVSPGPPSNAPRPLPAGPTQNPQVPVIAAPNSPPPSVPLPGPTIQTTPPILQAAPQPQWAPVQEEGPRLMLPK